MESKKHIVIFSHGFGVRKDDRGLLTDIEKVIPEAQSILFDYFDVDEVNKTLTIRSLSSQAEKLNQVIDEVKKNNAGAVIDLICHSQGTIVAALAKPEGVRKTILLTPVFDLSIQRTIKKYEARTGKDINLNSMSEIGILDGFMRIIPPEYWSDREKINTFKEYNLFAEKTEVTVIEANQDNVLEKVDLKDLSQKVKVLNLDGDHSFSGESREALYKTIREIIFN